ncbi:hypothetical protein GX48_03853 [Paracoccidioides brasiliensis]|nr:hypothetical protein GX48_03853 [Paracoccidioides brasiliensis]
MNGNIAGPLLFHWKDAPVHRPGLRVLLGVFVATIAIVGIQVTNLMVLNRLQSKKRGRNGKAAVIVDQSMKTNHYALDGVWNAVFIDFTDHQNDEIV